MGTFAITYSIVWLSVAAYVAWLGTRHRRLLETVCSLQSQLDRVAAGEPTP